MSIAFEIPLRFMTNEYYRVGTTMRSRATKRIVAHLQETPGMARMAKLGFDPASMIADGIQMYQNEQIKTGLAIVQNLQLANLALTGVGIGVSIAGFAILAHKLDRIEGRLTEIAAAISAVGKRVEGLQAHFARAELAALRAELRRIDEAWSRSDAQAQWKIAADRLLTLEQTFYDHALALGDATDGALLREQMEDAFVLAGGARLSALLAAEEMSAAEVAAHDFARSLKTLTGEIGAPQLLRGQLAAETPPGGPADRLKALERLRPEAEARAALLREREDSAATAPLTIAALARAGVSGRAWLARARDEVEAPLICLELEEWEAVEPVPA